MHFTIELSHSCSSYSIKSLQNIFFFCSGEFEDSHNVGNIIIIYVQSSCMLAKETKTRIWIIDKAKGSWLQLVIYLFLPYFFLFGSDICTLCFYFYFHFSSSFLFHWNEIWCASFDIRRKIVRYNKLNELFFFFLLDSVWIKSSIMRVLWDIFFLFEKMYK